MSDNGTALAFSAISLCMAFVCLALEVIFALIELLNWLRHKYSDDEEEMDLESSSESDNNGSGRWFRGRRRNGDSDEYESQ